MNEKTCSAPSPVCLDVDVSPDSESHFFVDLSGDLAHTGLFVATFRSIPVGTRVRIASHLPDGRLVVEGRVSWMREASCETGPGIGVALDDLPPGDLARVEEYCGERPPWFYEIDAA